MDIQVREVHWMAPKRKRLMLAISGLAEPPGGGCPQVRDHCEYEISDDVTVYDRIPHHLVIGRLGPLLEFFRLRRCPHPKHPDQEPWLHARTPEGIVPLWLGIWSDLREVAKVDPTLGRYVDIDYVALPYNGNIWRTHIEANALNALLQDRPDLDWHIEDSQHNNHVAVPVVTHKKPHEVSRHVYPNGQTGLTWGARINWSPDEGEAPNEVWLGAYWPTESDAHQALDHFARTGEQRVCANLSHLRTMFPDSSTTAALVACSSR